MTAPRTLPESKEHRRLRLGLAALLLVPGVAHFATPDFFEELVPTWMPGPASLWNQVAGAAELVAGSLVLSRRTEAIGARLALAVLVLVFPANIVDALTHPPVDARGVGAWLRLPLQLPMWWLALRVIRTRPMTEDS